MKPSSRKPNKPQYSLKLKIALFTGSFGHSLMVKVHQSSIPPPWVGVTLRTQQISEVGGLDPPT
jgi:hypothetical protein